MPMLPYSNRLEPANDAAVWRFMDLRKCWYLYRQETLDMWEQYVSAVSFHRKRTAENYRRGYTLRSATLGSTAAALRAGK